MADQSATFAIELDVKGQGGAQDMASALANLQQKIRADRDELRGLQAALKDLQGSASVDIGLFKQLREQITAKKAAIGEANSAFIKLGGTFGKTGGEAGDVATDLGGIINAAKGAAGPMGGLFEKVELFRGAIGKIGASKALAVAGIAAIAIAVIALTAALVSGVIALTKFALASADAARSSRLLLEANVGSAAAGAELANVVDNVSARSAIARSKVEGFAVSLSKAGLKGAELQTALEAIAIAASAGRDDLAQKFLKDAEAAAKAGKSVTDLANKIKGQLGGVAAKAALGLQNQLAKLKENLARIFAGVKIEGFLVALRSVLSLFDQSTASGKALRAMAEGMLNPIFSALSSLAPLAKGFFKGMIIGALVFTVAVLKVKQALSGVFGDAASGIDLLKAGVYLGIGAFGALLAIVGLVGFAMALAFLPALVAIAAIAVGVALLAAPFIAVGAAVYGLYLAFQAAWDAISGIDFAALGANIVQSIADAISAGAAWVVEAMTNLASSALGAFKGVFGIASPAKAMKEAGGNIVDGTVLGVEAKSGEADQALTDMMPVPTGKGGATGTVSAKGNTYHIHLHGISGDDLQDESFWSKVAAVLEAAQASSLPEPA